MRDTKHHKVHPVESESDRGRLIRERNEHRMKTAKEQLKHDKSNEKFTAEKTLPPSTVRVDAIILIVLLAEIIGVVGLVLEIYVYAMDADWNNVIAGEVAIEDVPDRHVFGGKTYSLEGHTFLKKAKEYATRSQPEELAFMIILFTCLVVAFVYAIGCHMRSERGSENAAFLIGVYATCGAVCILISIFLTSAATAIENNYEYAADMLHNFQHVFDKDPDLSDSNLPTECESHQYFKGCPSYEYARVQAIHLELIMRLCGDSSRITSNDQDRTSTQVTIQGEVYDKLELTYLGFCSRDAYKFIAALCSIVTGILFALVPVVFCCVGPAPGEKHVEPVEVITTKEVEKPATATPHAEEEPMPLSRHQKDIMHEFRMYIEKETTETEPEHSKSPHQHHHHRRHSKSHSPRSKRTSGESAEPCQPVPPPPVQAPQVVHNDDCQCQLCVCECDDDEEQEEC